MSCQLPASLAAARIGDLPSTAYYISDFITEEEERLILEKVASAPKPRWKQLTHRRLQTWPSDLVKDKLLESPLPPWLEEPVVSRLLSEGIDHHIFAESPHHRPNHVLINEYPPGVGIMPHKDGAAYWPVVCTVSLGSSLCLDLYRSRADGTLDPDPAWRILQEPRSLLITTESLYTDYLHGIADIQEDSNLTPETIVNWSLLRSCTPFTGGQHRRETRTSLTYRDVLKVSKAGSKSGMFSRR
ncbi:2OG-Fe(II) oxygenase superfamily protein [Sarocladium implicatum]|nr:2OG-Fe(II) oxygenase superfamily protein [Sarocladium implicatum]